jgi:hypothetical protein
MKWFSKDGDYAHILRGPAVHPDRAANAERAIRSGNYEERGTRDDGAMILVTRTAPPMVLIAKAVSEAGERSDLLLIHAAEVRGESLRSTHPPV